MNKVRKFYAEHKNDIVDIILFGSAARGKERPRDVDVLILFKEKRNSELSYKLRKALEIIGINVEVTDILYKDMLSSRFLPREDVLADGYSLILNKSLSHGFGYNPYILFKYGLKSFTQSQRVMFFYALEGRRKMKGVLRKLNGIKFTSSTVLIPTENSDEFENFLKTWRIDIKKTRILIPEKTVKYMRF